MLALHSNSKIFLTGGTGFLGRSLLDYALENLLDVDVLCRNPAQFQKDFPQYANRSKLRFIQGNILDPISPVGSYSHVIHAAADTHSAVENPAEWVKQIVFGTENVLDFAVRAKAQRFLLLSSGAVYGPQPSYIQQLTEDYLGAPSTTLHSSVYGQSKRLAEQLCTSKNHKGSIETVVARCFAFGGKHIPLNGPYALGNFIRDALYNSSIIVKGDGSAIRSYLAGEDMAKWLFTILAKGEAGQAYNVGSHDPISMEELANKVRDLLAFNKQVVIEKEITNCTERSIYIPSIQKASQLGLHQTIDLDSIIVEVAQHLKKVNHKHDA